MLALGLSLAACLGWGISDYIGGMKSRSLPALTVLLFSNIFGFIVICAIVWGRGVALPGHPGLLWAVLGGIVAIGAMTLLYKGLAVGPMSIVAPISATGVILPVMAGLWFGEALSGHQAAGIVLAVVGSVLAAWKRENGAGRKAVEGGAGFAVGAALFIGTFFIIMDHASDVDPYWATLLMKFSYSVFLVPVILAVRPPLTVGRSHFPGIVTAGSIDTLATFAFTLATSLGMLSVVSVVSSLYPAVTVVLSAVLLKERPRPVQAAGVISALAGIVLISAG